MGCRSYFASGIFLCQTNLFCQGTTVTHNDLRSNLYMQYVTICHTVPEERLGDLGGGEHPVVLPLVVEGDDV